ncbi:hypothetical protein, partial [Luteirhabdus pelagi]|uniref:hypothetical protein n=1 Tax=Luteirhabdus pelagi TaxID=2792783 RepID=UPI001F19F038
TVTYNDLLRYSIRQFNEFAENFPNAWLIPNWNQPKQWSLYIVGSCRATGTLIRHKLNLVR